MKLTKYGHACVFIENNNSKIVVDPGAFTDLPTDLNNIVAVICTHVHGDHTDPKNLQKIVNANPDVKIYATKESITEISDIGCEKYEVTEDQQIKISESVIDFYVLDHAVVWKTSPCSNLAIKINDFYYYPGDSFNVIPDEVELVGVPVSAPWLKISEAIDFTRAMNSRNFMPTHNGLYNEFGLATANNWLNTGFEGMDRVLVNLQIGDSFESSKS